MRIGLAFGALVVALSSGACEARGVAASYNGALGGSYTIGLSIPSVYFNTAAGMTFISHADGKIDSLNVYMGWNVGTPSNLTVSFFTLNGSNLPDTLVASRTVSQSDLAASVGGGNFGLVTIDFTTGPTAYLSNGFRYAFTVVAENTGNFDGGPLPPFSLGMDASGATFAEGSPLFSADGGATWGTDSYPVPFTVNSSVPTPGAVGGIGLVAIGAVVRRRR